MQDLTIIYYTANLISDFFADNVRRHLLQVTNMAVPIISVSHKPIAFGHNICVGEQTPLAFNVYKQILAGAHAARTEYVACCEDDTLYNNEHLSYRPLICPFAYNMSKWHVSPDTFYHRDRAVMAMNISNREALIEVLTKRFEKYPKVIDGEDFSWFGEPGRCEKNLGLPEVDMELFRMETPPVIFNHRPSLGGKRKILRSDTLSKSLPGWGDAKTLWEKIHG